MRLIALSQAKPGMILGRQIYDEFGNLLIGSGVEMDEALIQRLRNLGVSFIYVEDELGEGIDLEHDIVSHSLRMEFYHQVKKTYKAIEEGIEAKRSVEEIAACVDRSRLASLVDETIDELSRKKNAIVDLLYPKDEKDYLCMHATNVALLSTFLAFKMGMPVRDIFSVGLGSVFADIGMLFVPKEIREKPGPLSPEEWEIVKKHPEKGFGIVRKVNLMDAKTASITYQHHERMDGSGYPRALKGDDVFRYARIVAVADVFDALTSPRPWREAFLADESISFIEQEVRKGKLDRSVFEVFRKTFAPYPRGTAVLLSDGTIGLVVKNNPADLKRPVVKVIWDMDGNRIPQRSVDLSQERSLHVVRGTLPPE